MATRDSMNMGSSRTSNIIFEAKSGISGMRQEASLLNQTLESTRSILSGISDKIKGAFGFGGGGESGGSNQVAPNPSFGSTTAVATTDGKGMSVAADPSTPIVGGSGFDGGVTNLTSHVAQYGGATLYQPEAGTVAMGTGGGGGGGFGGSTGGGSSSSGGKDSSSVTSRIANALGPAGSLISGLFALYNVAADMMPSTADILEGQLLQQRASYFSGGGKSGISDVRTSQRDIAQLAMLSGDNPQMDVLRAQIAAQSYGLGTTVGGSLNNLMTGAARVSNLMPGIGVEGSIRATGAMQQAYNVNMLRGIGIQIRNADGSLKPIDKVIDDIWQKICRDYSQAYGSGATPKLEEVQISLQPGNALDSMLNQYFGNDPMLKQLVANGLIYRAQSGGGTVASLTKETVNNLGGTTQAMISYTQTAAAGQNFITSGGAVGGATSGFETANTFIKSYYDTMSTTLSSVTQGILSLKSTIDTALTAFNGDLFAVFGAMVPAAFGGIASFLRGVLPVVGQIPSALTNLFNNPSIISTLVGALPGMATGGTVDANTPYIIGEKGPEIFVPTSNGTILPNDKLTAAASNNTYNFTVNVTNGSGPEVVTAIKNLITELETSKRMSES